MTTPLASWARRRASDEATAKVPKRSTLYLHVLPRYDGQGGPRQTQYQCRDCPMFIADALRCTIHGPADMIQAHGTCGYFVPGAPTSLAAGAAPHGNVTTAESGYEENEAGFSCKRCAAFVEGGDDCRVVDRFSAGDDPGRIDPNACCAAWTPGPRAKAGEAAFARQAEPPRA